MQSLLGIWVSAQMNTERISLILIVNMTVFSVQLAHSETLPIDDIQMDDVRFETDMHFPALIAQPHVHVQATGILAAKCIFVIRPSSWARRPSTKWHHHTQTDDIFKEIDDCVCVSPVKQTSRRIDHSTWSMGWTNANRGKHMPTCQCQPRLTVKSECIFSWSELFFQSEKWWSSKKERKEKKEDGRTFSFR